MRKKLCDNCGGGIMDKSRDINDNPVWVCRCCGDDVIRLVRNRKVKTKEGVRALLKVLIRENHQ